MAAILLAALAQTTLAAKPAGKSTHQVRQERPDRGAIRGAKPSITKAKAFLRGTIQPQAKPENTRTIVRSALNRTCRRSADRRRLRRRGPIWPAAAASTGASRGASTGSQWGRHRCSGDPARETARRYWRRTTECQGRIPINCWVGTPARRRQCATGAHRSHQWHRVRTARDSDGPGRGMGKPVAVANGTSIKARRSASRLPARFPR